MLEQKILVFSGSVRSGSYNAQLAAAMVKILALRDAYVTHISLSDYPLPLYDGDLEARSGPPEMAKKLHALFCAHAGCFIASPEYNASFSPLVKNTLDWLSRVRNLDSAEAGRRGERISPFRGAVFALGSASPGELGGMRGLMALRPVLEIGLGALVLPGQITVPKADSAFDSSGALLSESLQKRLEAVASSLMTHVRALTPRG